MTLAVYRGCKTTTELKHRTIKVSTLIDPGPGSSKLMTSLVNVSLKFQTLIIEIRQYFLLKKCEKLFVQKLLSFFQQKISSVFGYKVLKYLTT